VFIEQLEFHPEKISAGTEQTPGSLARRLKINLSIGMDRVSATFSQAGLKRGWKSLDFKCRREEEMRRTRASSRCSTVAKRCRQISRDYPIY